MHRRRVPARAAEEQTVHGLIHDETERLTRAFAARRETFVCLQAAARSLTVRELARFYYLEESFPRHEQDGLVLRVIVDVKLCRREIPSAFRPMSWPVR